MKWIEGTHYEALEGEGFKCLKCGKTIASKPGLGPHLTACYSDQALEGEGESLLEGRFRRNTTPCYVS